MILFLLKINAEEKRRKKIKEKCGFEDKTMEYLASYKYANGIETFLSALIEATTASAKKSREMEACISNSQSNGLSLASISLTFKNCEEMREIQITSSK